MQLPKPIKFFSLLGLLCLFTLLIGCDEWQRRTGSSEQDLDNLISQLTLTTEQLQAGIGTGQVMEQGMMMVEEGAAEADFESPIIEANTEFNFAVPLWVADVPEGSELNLLARTAPADSEEWTAWKQIDINPDLTFDLENTFSEFAQTAGTIISTSNLDLHQRIQFVINFEKNIEGKSPTLEELSVVFVNGDGPTTQEILSNMKDDTQNKPRAQAEFPRPTIIPRSEWCPDGCPANFEPQYFDVSHLIVHHTVTSNDSADWASTVRAIWLFHTQTREWRDIGYNYLIDPEGNIYEGHTGGDNVIGVHASDANRGSMGVALLGTYNTVRPPEPMLDALADLMAWKADKENINLWEASTWPDPAIDWGNLHLLGHRDIYGTTQCPGDLAHSLIPDIRQRIADRIDQTAGFDIYDELSPAFSRTDANWYDPPFSCGFNGHSWFSFSTTDSSISANTGIWRPNIPSTGRYQIDAYIPRCNTGDIDTSQAPYTISHANGTATRVMDQRAYLGLWMPLGEYDLNAGTSTTISLGDVTASQDNTSIWFDAIRVRPLDSPIPIINTQSPSQDQWFTDRTIEFGWTANNIETGRLQVATDAGFSNIVTEQAINLADGSLTQTFGSDFADLYWRIAFESQATAPVRFHIDSTPPNSRVGSVLNNCDGSYTLLWSGADDISDVEAYDIEFRRETDTEWSTLLANTTATETTFTPADNAEYLFRSTATDTRGNREGDKPNGDIALSAAPSCELVAPSPISPRGAGWQNNRVVTFRWRSQAAGASGYLFEVARDEAFTDIVISKELPAIRFAETEIFEEDAQQLFWRVSSLNQEGTPSTSEPSAFRIDTAPPQSSITRITEVNTNSYALRWDVNDSLAGVDTVSIQAVVEGSTAWQEIASNNRAGDLVFTPENPNLTYLFRAIAEDNAGNRERDSKPAETGTNLACRQGDDPVVLNEPNFNTPVAITNLTFSWAYPKIGCAESMQLEVSRNRSFSDVVQREDFAPAIAYSTSVDPIQEVLFWRINTIDTFGNLLVSLPQEIRFDFIAPVARINELTLLPAAKRYLVTVDASDNSTGVNRLIYEYRTSGTSAWIIWTITSQDVTIFVPPEPSRAYDLRVRAVDNAGNPSSGSPNGDISTTDAEIGNRQWLPIIGRSE